MTSSQNTALHSERAVPHLRDYQVDVIRRFEEEVSKGNRRVLLVAPTGSGKTVIGGAIVSAYVDAGKKVLFWAHRRELVSQASRKLYDTGIDHGIIQAGHPTRPYEPVQVASIQTLAARALRSRRMDLPDADLLVVDEAHHIRASTYLELVEAYPNAVLLGLTATPCRGDGKGLGSVFDVIVECPSVQALIDAGHLVPTKVYAPATPDLKGVKIQSGDYAIGQLEKRVDTPELVGDIVTHWNRLAERRKTVVFATGVDHSVHIRNCFRESGVVAEHIDGNTPVGERAEILAKLSRGEVDVVSNCMVLTEGWDQPDVSCLVLARPTKSLGLYRQMIGRVLRPAPGKDHALILDHSGAVFQHGFAEDDIEWTLSENDKAINREERNSKGELKKREFATCPECKAVILRGDPCGACGWQPRPKAEVYKFRDGDLAQVDRYGRVSHHNPDQTRWLAELRHIGKERGYKPGWAAFKFKEKFGAWPPRHLENAASIPASDEIRSWVRSRQIAWAKEQATKAGGAR